MATGGANTNVMLYKSRNLIKCVIEPSTVGRIDTCAMAAESSVVKIADWPQVAECGRNLSELERQLKAELSRRGSAFNPGDTLLYDSHLNDRIWKVLCENCQTGRLIVPNATFDVKYLKFKRSVNKALLVKRLYVSNIYFRSAQSSDDICKLLDKILEELIISEPQPIDKIRNLIKGNKLNVLVAVAIYGFISDKDITLLRDNAPNLRILDVNSNDLLSLKIFAGWRRQLASLTVRSAVHLSENTNVSQSFSNFNTLHLLNCIQICDYSFVSGLTNATEITITDGRSTAPSWIDALAFSDQCIYLDLSYYDGDMGEILDKLVKSDLALEVLKLNRKSREGTPALAMLADSDVIQFLEADSVCKRLRHFEIRGHKTLTKAILNCDSSAYTPRGLLALETLDLRDTRCHLEQPV
jgi:hypothetical protein